MVLREFHVTRLAGLALFCAIGAGASAQGTDSSAAAAPVVVGGFVDSYFSVTFGRRASHVNRLRIFDVTENQIIVSNAEMSITKAAAPVGARADLDFGPTNDIVHGGAPGSLANVGQAYLTYALNEASAITVRGELYSDPSGYTSGISQNLQEITLTYEYRPVTSLILRTEYRYDAADGAAFDGENGPLSRRNQGTLGIGGIVVF